jgi:large subunit ribosomal protein L18
VTPQEKERLRLRRHHRVRKKLFGTQERPRLSVHRSHLHLVAQLVNDFDGKILLTCSTRDPEFQKAYPKGGNVEAAKQLGQTIAKKVIQSGVKQVLFDRGGFPYHGRVKALAEALRSQGVAV